MTRKLVVWSSAAVPKAVVLHRHSEIEDPWELHEGVPRAATFPAGCTYTMHPDFPRHTLLVDNLINTDGLLVVSLRLRQFLEARGVKQVEYLLVAILDHRGRAASRDYFIAHPLENVDCLDLGKSGARASAIDPAGKVGSDTFIFHIFSRAYQTGIHGCPLRLQRLEVPLKC